jgi:hypothetical protein
VLCARWAQVPAAEARFVRPHRMSRRASSNRWTRSKGAKVRWTRYLLVASACSLAACTHRLAAPYPATLPVDQRVEVWQGHSSTVLTHVTFDSLGVSGQNGPWRPDCGTCRVTIPLAQTDSVRLVNNDAAWAFVGTVALVSAFLLNHCWSATGCE